MTHISKEIIKTEERTDGIRLNKFLADAGICSRREADRLIEGGLVFVDGKKAETGQRVFGNNIVEYKGKEVKQDNNLIIIAFNKPAGIECTTDLNNPDNIISFISYPSRIFPIGRLDKDSTGLILLTNTGDISDKILRSANRHEKEYEVSVDKAITKEFLKSMSEGVEIELKDGTEKRVTDKCRITATGKCTFNIVLTQGLNRQIRRMCDALGYKVISLKRVRIMNVNLGNLNEGHFRRLSEAEIKRLVKDINGD